MDQKKKGLNLTKPESTFNLAEKEFNLENFEYAIKQYDICLDQVEEIEQKELLLNIVSKEKLGESIVLFIKNNWWKIILILLISTPILIFLYVLFMIRFFEDSIKKMTKELQKITEIQKSLQMDYFKHASLDKKTYLAAMENLDDRSSVISNKKGFYEKKLILTRTKFEILMRKLHLRK